MNCLDDVKRKHDGILLKDGIPVVCAKKLGYLDSDLSNCDCDCKKCWYSEIRKESKK